MILISDIQITSNYWDVLSLFFSEGNIGKRFISHHGPIIIVADEKESQTGSGVCYRIVCYDADLPVNGRGKELEVILSSRI